jgi:FkbM family methyltransferase
MSIRQRAGWLAHLFKAVTQQHHRELRATFAPYIPADGVVLDIGAHAGQFSKLFARMAPQGQVFAFEPSRYARTILHSAIKMNGIRNVTVVPVGLSDAKSEMTLYTPIKRRGGLGFGTASLGERHRNSHQQIVDLITLDSMNFPRVDFIKADIEGWEARMISGAMKTIATHKPTLYLEINEDALRRAGSSREDIWNQLTPLGYDAIPVTPDDYLFVSKAQSENSRI